MCVKTTKDNIVYQKSTIVNSFIQYAIITGIFLKSFYTSKPVDSSNVNSLSVYFFIHIGLSDIVPTICMRYLKDVVCIDKIIKKLRQFLFS